MKAIITTIALSSVLAAGTAVAANNVQLDQTSGTAIQTGSHYSSKELIVVDAPNLTTNNDGLHLYIGSK